jgi:ketosteroid isomerase-like protein
MEGGRVRGHAAVREYWTRQWETIDPRVEPVRVAETPDGRVVVDVHQVVRERSGALLVDQMVRHVYRMRDGLVTSMEIEAGVS